MHYNIIATGSTGNAVVVNDCILVDCGVSFKSLNKVYKDIKLVLLTHEHGDHFKAQTIKRLAQDRPTLRFGCCKWLVPKLLNAGVNTVNIDVYEIGKMYDYRAFKVSPIKLYHDVPNAGYRVHFADGGKMVYATDTAHMQGIKAKDYDLYLIEANYQEDELEERIIAKTAAGQYCYELNVANRHLSHEQASEWLMQNMSKNSEYCFLHQHKEKKDDWGYIDE